MQTTCFPPRWALSILGIMFGLTSAAASAQTAPVMDWQQPAAKRLQPAARAQIVMLGEQHDAPEHQALHRDTIEWLAKSGRLAAVVIEMAEDEQHTQSLTQDASESAVQQALSWQESWPWASYGPVVMAAVRAGVPVWGGNLPRSQMRAAMQNSSLDSVVPLTAFKEQQARIREGHCNMLPESQITPMTRIQLARDQAMAQRVLAILNTAPAQDRQVLLIAGNGHVRRDLGVPLYLPAAVSSYVVMALPVADTVPSLSVQVADAIWLTPQRPPQDYCADLKQQMKR